MNDFQPVSDAILRSLEDVVGSDNVSTAEAERQLRSQDMSKHGPRSSEVVVWPETSQHVVDVLRIANDHCIPVTAWGAGSSLEGNPIPLYGGISLSMERMNAIVAIHDGDFQVTVQPGIGYKDLNAELARYGLFFAPDPGANASIGGMLANNAAGSRTVKYGATKDNVLAMEVALADGRLINLGSRSIKQSAGYDLVHLFVGSEGTLGITTQATLKLDPIPTIMSSVLAAFPTVEAAIEVVIDVRSSALDIAALEFIDGRTASLVTRVGEADWGETPVLLMEIHAAHLEAAELDLALIRELCEASGATDVQVTSDTAERKRMWHARHHLFETKVRYSPGESWQVMDIAVPISAYPRLVAYAAQALREYAIDGYMIGHAGDGNLHVELPYTDDDSLGRATAANEAIVAKAIALDGTSSGEHGVGIGKAKYMRLEHGAGLDVMQELKNTLDPRRILNPGKIFPREGHAGE